MDIRYALLQSEDISAALFNHFQRCQTVTRCWRKQDGKWTIQDIAFVDDWSAAEYGKLVTDLIDTCNQGGAVIAAFCGDQLKDFAAVLPTLFGQHGEYLDIPSLHVSQEMRGCGIGSALFGMAKQWAKAHGAKSSIYPLTPPWKARRFTGRWAVWRRRSITGSMCGWSLATASWNAACRVSL